MNLTIIFIAIVVVAIVVVATIIVIYKKVDFPEMSNRRK